MEDNTNEIQIHIKGNKFNKLVKTKYTLISSIFCILKFLDNLKLSVKDIDLIHISFSAFSTRSNIDEINKLTIDILSCKLFIKYCDYYGSRVLVYDEKIYPKRIFNIIISNDETFLNADTHICANTRDQCYRERSIMAEPY